MNARELGKQFCERLAAELVSVQPINVNLVELSDYQVDETVMLILGYVKKPFGHHGLLVQWVKE